MITGGARGLGLVMSQALVISGCDVAIVDLNSEATRNPTLFYTMAANQSDNRGGGRQTGHAAHADLC